MKTLQQMLSVCDPEKISRIILTNYEHEKDHFDAYVQMITSLRSRNPSLSTMAYITVEPNAEDDLVYYHVSHVDMEDQVWAADFTPWDEWLNLFVKTELPDDDALAHIIWEMTFHGFDESRIKEMRDDLFDSSNAIKAVFDRLDDPDLTEEQKRKILDDAGLVPFDPNTLED